MIGIISVSGRNFSSNKLAMVSRDLQVDSQCAALHAKAMTPIYFPFKYTINQQYVMLLNYYPIKLYFFYNLIVIKLY